MGGARPGPVTLPLAYPLEVGTEVVTELVLKRPKAKDLRRIPGSEPTMDDLLTMGGFLCCQPPSVIDELDIEDATALLDVVTGFFDSGPTGGSKASPLSPSDADGARPSSGS